jgi:hypothetical protein
MSSLSRCAGHTTGRFTGQAMSKPGGSRWASNPSRSLGNSGDKPVGVAIKPPPYGLQLVDPRRQASLRQISRSKHHSCADLPPYIRWVDEQQGCGRSHRLTLLCWALIRPAQRCCLSFDVSVRWSKARSIERTSHTFRLSILRGRGILPSATISSNFPSETRTYIVAS